jgi:hypothetical protein
VQKQVGVLDTILAPIQFLAWFLLVAVAQQAMARWVAVVAVVVQTVESHTLAHQQELGVVMQLHLGMVLEAVSHNRILAT